MWKKAIFGAATLMIAGTMIVYAQQGPGGPAGAGGPSSPGGPNAEHMGTFSDARIAAPHEGFKLNAEDMAAFADARIAALHAGLRLSADQEKIWPAFEQALHDLAKMRMDRFATARDLQPPSDPVQRLQRRADALNTRGAALKRLADTLAPLYQSFDEGQKRRFTILARFMRPHPRHFGQGRGKMDGRGGDNFYGNPHHFGGGEGMRD
jgi:zinc resistance-associated protein